MQLVGPEGYTLCRLVLQMEDVSDFVLEYQFFCNLDYNSENGFFCQIPNKIVRDCKNFIRNQNPGD